MLISGNRLAGDEAVGGDVGAVDGVDGVTAQKVVIQEAAVIARTVKQL